MVRRVFFVLLGLVTLCMVAAPCLADEIEANPAETRIVLNALLSVSNQSMPATCSCSGSYGQPGRARVRDFLSMQLAYLYRGENRITGSIQGHGNIKQCALTITHAAGEDVSSTEIRFMTKNGRVLLGTLQCIMTP